MAEPTKPDQQKQPEAQRETVGQPSGNEVSAPKEVAVKAETRSKTQAHLEEVKSEDLPKLEEEKKKKETERDELVKQTQSNRETEGWTEKAYNAPLDEAKKEIIAAVEKDFPEKVKQIESETGITISDKNKLVLKETAKKIALEFCGRRFGWSDYIAAKLNPSIVLGPMTEFAEELGKKLRSLFEKIKSIKEQDPSTFPTIEKVIAGFSTFTGLNFMKEDNLLGEGTLNLLKLTETSLMNKIDGYRTYLGLEKDINRLNGDITNLRAQSGDVGELFKKGEIKLNGSPKIVIIDPAKTQNLNESDYSKLAGELGLNNKIPQNIAAGIKDKIVAYVMSEAKKVSFSAGEALELKENGTWEKTKIEAQVASPPETTPETETPVEVKKLTGVAFIDNTLASLEKDSPILYMIFTFILSAFGMIKSGADAKEFEGLDIGQKKDAGELKEACTKLELKPENMALLFKDAAKTKEVLKAKSESKTEKWEDFLKSRLEETEIKDLKKETKDLNAEKIAKMLTTPIPEEPGKKTAVSAAAAPANTPANTPATTAQTPAATQPDKPAT